jgi:N-acetylmuramic acid 6-phosphate etherase
MRDLVTEAQNSTSADVDALDTVDMLRVINAADEEIPGAVAREIPNIARAVDVIAERLQTGGRLFYLGAGTGAAGCSGRVGMSADFQYTCRDGAGADCRRRPGPANFR